MSAYGTEGESPSKSSLILMVDDISKNLQVLASILGNAGYEMAAAKSAGAALKIVDKVTPDLILMDVMMPEMDGFELCRKLKETERFREIPVIFLTARTDTKDLVEGFEAGGVDYITKPFNRSELLTRVKTHLQLKWSKEQLNESIQQLQRANNEILEKNKKIEEINHHMTDSISYAQLIQQAILPKKQDIKSVFGDSFVFFRPRDVVSGDFFWISNNDNRVVIAAVDCTGHGVPGAFISILGYQLMHEIILVRGIYEPDTILNTMHREIKAVFDHEDTASSGGMDMALCTLDFQNQTLEFAGARNPLVYFHRDKFYEIKGNRCSVGDVFRNRQNCVFTKQVVPIRENTMFYLFSDGFCDQLGVGEHRFTRKKFRELLTEIHPLPMDKQSETLEKRLVDWMGNEYGQIDDILVLGFRL
ncbi:MAG: response regulator [bacterium]|nr:response regulator [bacterium]